jgi:hypothetical protein
MVVFRAKIVSAVVNLTTALRLSKCDSFAEGG